MMDKLYDRGLETSRARFATSISSSGVDSPDKKRHIHFNKEVLQCIAIAKEEKEWLEFGGESSWDDSYIVKPAFPRVATPPGSFSGENKTIAPLPPTTLKYHGDAPEPRPSIISCWSWKKHIPGYQLHPSSFGEALRQSRELLSALGEDHIKPGVVGKLLIPPSEFGDWLFLVLVKQINTRCVTGVKEAYAVASDFGGP